jgi:hypothetical protein
MFFFTAVAIARVREGRGISIETDERARKCITKQTSQTEKQICNKSNWRRRRPDGGMELVAQP